MEWKNSHLVNMDCSIHNEWIKPKKFVRNHSWTYLEGQAIFELNNILVIDIWFTCGN
jgi:hypothetical protein